MIVKKFFSSFFTNYLKSDDNPFNLFFFKFHMNGFYHGYNVDWKLNLNITTIMIIAVQNNQ